MGRASESRVRRFSQAVTEREVEAAVAECHPDVQFFSTLASLDGTAFEGHEGIRRYFREVREAWDEWEVELEDVREAPDGRVAVAMTMHSRARLGGPVLEQRVGHVWRIRDGLLFHCTPFRDPADAFAEVGLTAKR